MTEKTYETEINLKGKTGNDLLESYKKIADGFKEADEIFNEANGSYEEAVKIYIKRKENKKPTTNDIN